ncbi:restriction endonuclease [Microvirga brassicacearum]|uniref:Restriction endonuclease n=1 Tax=Microvirga brassicacearum TaxID=2580413 RepID=A0A5N3P615_9HYPH|nr:restriction endonuclease [Microvirga brassicacearum]KAB0265135.1 restriction endonuclease [Microvirga brassicacearum]
MTETQKRLLHTGLQNYDHVDLDAGAVFFSEALRVHACPCCAIGLLVFEHELPTTPLKPAHAQFRWLTLEICPSCGWWHFHRELETSLPEFSGKVLRSSWWELTHALQSEIDLRATTLPIEMLQRHLVRRWEDRKMISAQQAEDLVASLLQEHHGGQVVRISTNANSADGGIDLYLAESNGIIQRAIQVKRRISAETESVKEVRNFVGAMVLAKVDRGIFVTTASRFTKVAKDLPRQALDAKFKLELDLVDGGLLLEMLRGTNSRKPAQLPPQVMHDQEWKDVRGRTLLARDLFTGDIREWL